MTGRSPHPMLPTLEGEKLVHRPERTRIPRLDADLSAPRQRMVVISDVTPPLAHYRGARHLARVHEAGDIEVAARERLGDRLEMGPDLRHPRGVGRVALELAPAAAGESVETVRRGVLVHAHSGLAARLHRRERGVRIGSGMVMRVLRQGWRGDGR